MNKKSNPMPPLVASKPAPPTPPPAIMGTKTAADTIWENPATWAELLGKDLAERFFGAAGEGHPVDHLRHVVREYYYLQSIGA